MLGGAAAVFVTGAAVMVAELIAARLTAPFYGQSTATWAALAGVTLLGVTLGNYLGGRLAAQSNRPFLVALLGAVGGAVALAALPSLLAPLAAVVLIAAALRRGGAPLPYVAHVPHAPCVPISLAPLAHVFLVGFVGMASELALARLVTPVLGGSHIVWSAVFVTFIGFMGVGGIVGGRAADRFASRVPAKALYAVLFAALYATVLFQTRALGLWTMGCDAAVRIALHVLVGFAPYAFVLGFLSAFLLQKATAPALKAGGRASIGLAYAANGVGEAKAVAFWADAVDLDGRGDAVRRVCALRNGHGRLRRDAVVKAVEREGGLVRKTMFFERPAMTASSSARVSGKA